MSFCKEKTSASQRAYLVRILGAPELLGQVPVLAVAGAVHGHLLAPAPCRTVTEIRGQGRMSGKTWVDCSMRESSLATFQKNSPQHRARKGCAAGTPHRLVRASGTPAGTGVEPMVLMIKVIRSIASQNYRRINGPQLKPPLGPPEDNKRISSCGHRRTPG